MCIYQLVRHWQWLYFSFTEIQLGHWKIDYLQKSFSFEILFFLASMNKSDHFCLSPSPTPWALPYSYLWMNSRGSVDRLEKSTSHHLLKKKHTFINLIYNLPFISLQNLLPINIHCKEAFKTGVSMFFFYLQSNVDDYAWSTLDFTLLILYNTLWTPSGRLTLNWQSMDISVDSWLSVE